jgi:heparanase 1
MKHLLPCALLLALVVSCSDDDGGQTPAPERQAIIYVDIDKPIYTVDARFLSFAVDTAQVVGGEFWDPAGGTENVKVSPYDFTRPQLRRLAKELAPAYLRIGGTDADKTFYDLSDTPVATPPQSYTWVMTRAQWDGVGAFAKELDLRLLFTLNAGLGPRDAQKVWLPENARELIRYTRSEGYPVDIWELGNELNGFALHLGFALDEQQYAADLKAAKALLAAEDPEALLAGPSCAYWPKSGDMVGFYDKFMKLGAGELDLVTWHYYPQQSRRCAAANLRAAPKLMLQPQNLDELTKWAVAVEDQVRTHAPKAPVWLGETGGAQCGGEPGISDAFEGSFWWLDQLGQLAARGQQVVVRQTLSGATYGLIDDATLEPNPDYWASVLWKRLMGTTVLSATKAAPDDLLRIYVHCAEGQEGGITALALNLSGDRPVRITLRHQKGSIETHLVTADSLQSRQVKLNGAPLSVADNGALPPLAPDVRGAGGGDPFVDLPPYSYAFITLKWANAQACR